MNLKYMLISLLIICIVAQCCHGKKGKKKKKTRKGNGKQKKLTEECALFRDPSLYHVKENGPSYIRLDKYDFTGYINITFWVLPDRTFHNGPLFNIGSEDNFKYYEWKTKALKTQFMVLEITYEAVALLTKVLWQKHMKQTELFTTHPDPYNLINGYWANITAARKDKKWTLALNDTVVKVEDVINQTDINLSGRHTYLGGRPGYTDNVFRGIIKGLRVNDELVSLKGRKMVGNAEVHDCDSEEVKQFAKELVVFETDGYPDDDSEPWYYQDGYEYPYDGDGDRLDNFGDKLRDKNRGGYNSFMDNNDNGGDDGFFSNVYGLPI